VKNTESISVDDNKTHGTGFFKALLWLLIIIVLVLTIIFYPKNLPFWQFNVTDVVILLVSLFLVAAFIERAVEVVIVVWRDKGRKQLEKVLYLERLKTEKAKKDGSREITRAEEEATKKLENYKAETGSTAMPLAFVLGIIISALGIRALQPLVDPAVFKTLTMAQKTLFTGIDTLITGALLGGGSKGIHEIIEAFLNTVEKYRENLKTK
jgi:hypothetical protein